MDQHSESKHSETTVDASKLNEDDHYPVPHHYYTTKLHEDPAALIASLEANPCVKRFWLDSPDSSYSKLFGYTYTDITSIVWDDHTEAARGIVFRDDPTGPILVALPFPKFHNFGKGPPQGSTVIEHVGEKLDGSLGIIFWCGKEWRLCTRGSFPYDPATGKGSKEAAWGLERLMSHHDPSALQKDYTYLVEILCEETRVVIPYPKEKEGLWLLGAYHTPTGYEMRHSVLAHHGERACLPMAEDFSSKSLDDLLASAKTLSGIETEGYVVRFADGQRRKIKGEDYLRLHRSFVHFTPSDAWVALSQGALAHGEEEALRRYMMVLPDEFHEEARATVQPWMDGVKAKREEITTLLEPYSEMKAVGQAVKAKTLPPYAIQAFLARTRGQAKDSQSFERQLWKLFKP